METEIIIFLCVLLILFFVLLVIREYQNWIDRKDLMDRVMCKDWNEYKKLNKPVAAKQRQFPTFMTDEDLSKAEKK